MSHASNADRVRHMLLASNVGDVDAFLDRVHPEVEWHSVGLFLHPAQIWRGHADLRRGMEWRVEHHRGHPQVTLREVSESGDVVLVVGAIAVPTSRRPAILPVAWTFRMVDDKVSRAHTFTTEQLARVEWAILTRDGDRPPGI
ncbi:MAG: nuclear transport factor 2 family protein [Actinomycetota bacterium]|nr:nuclear transport factor 2 family protein [Actinomycetota bacterium]